MRLPLRLSIFAMVALWLFAFEVQRAFGDLSTNLEGYWEFDGNGNDSSGNGRDLNLVGSPGFTTGLFGMALNLTGDANTYAERPVSDTAFGFGAGDFTIQIWVNFTSTDNEQVLIEKFTGGGGPGWTFTKLSTQVLQFYFDPFGGTNSTSALSITTGVWNQFVARRNGATLDIFFNGAIVGTSNVGATAITTTTNPLLIGARRNGNVGSDTISAPLNGAVDETAIWSRALSDAEITGLYAGGFGQQVPEPSSVALFGAGLLSLVAIRCRR
jgi:hypothetical protein